MKLFFGFLFFGLLSLSAGACSTPYNPPEEDEIDVIVEDLDQAQDVEMWTDKDGGWDGEE